MPLDVRPLTSVPDAKPLNVVTGEPVKKTLETGITVALPLDPSARVAMRTATPHDTKCILLGMRTHLRWEIVT